MKKKLTIVVAMDSKRGIGLNNGIAWKIPADMRHFKDTTSYGVMIMGRKTAESIGRALTSNHRRSIVITRQKDWSMPGVETASSLEEAISMVNDHGAFVIGGGEIYKEALPLCDHMIITKVEGDFGCDTFFPEFNVGEWNCWEKETKVDIDSGIPFAFASYIRKVGGNG